MTPIIKKLEAPFIIAICFNNFSGSYFVDFKSSEVGTIISLKISEGEALGLSKHLNLKITI